MSDQTAIRSLRAAIAVVQEDCTGPEYKSLIAAVNVADKAAEAASAADSGSEPRDLKQAAVKAREQFAASRAAK